MAAFFFNKKNLFWVAYFICSTVTLLSLWTSKYLPMVDLPQHAAQISIINNLHIPSFGFESQYQLNWFTPYAVGYFLTSLLAKAFGVNPAIKLTIALSALGLSLATHYLLSQTGGDPWWSLLGFPMSFGFAFWWGFYNYVIAVPLGVAYVALGFSYARRMTWGNTILLIFLSILLFFAHAIVFGVSTVSVLGVILFSSPYRTSLLRCLPILATVPFLLKWSHSVGGLSRFQELIELSFSAAQRMRFFLSFLCGTWEDHLGKKIAAILMILILLTLRRPRFNIQRLIPFAAALSIYCFIPSYAFDISYVYERLAVFVVIFALVFLSPTQSSIRLAIVHLLILFVIVFWMGVLTCRFAGFNKEAKGFDDILAHMEPNKNVSSHIYDGFSGFVPMSPFGHFVAWYQAEKGGRLSYSFGELYNMVAQYKPGVKHPFEFDYYVVRSFNDQFNSLFGKENKSVVLEARSGSWWLYRRIK